MPELPEVETMRRCIEPAVGRTITRVWRPPSRLQSIRFIPSWRDVRNGLKGRLITSVARLGKRLVLHLDNSCRLVIEPRMTGLVMMAHPPDRTHLRLVVELRGRDRPELLFWDQRGLGVVQLLTAASFDRQFGPARIGPDAWTVAKDEFPARFRGSSRPIKVALLDQKRLAGIGNLYASEMLHRARIHPSTPCNRLAKADWLRLWKAMKAVLAEAIAHQGTTLQDGTYRIAADELGSHQHHLRVYQRHGQQCLRCRSVQIVRIVQAQRSTFFCPHCQAEPSKNENRRRDG